MPKFHTKKKKKLETLNYIEPYWLIDTGTYNNNTTTFHYGFHFHRVWGDSTIDNLISTDILIHREDTGT